MSKTKEQPIRILVVDDEQEIRALLSRHFRYRGFEVDTAEDGRSALASLARTKTDIVISDIRMPGMDGIELLRAIRTDHPPVHVVMITGYVTQSNILACMNMGARTCVFKPFQDLGILEKAVDDAVADIRHWLSLLKELQGLKPGKKRS